MNRYCIVEDDDDTNTILEQLMNALGRELKEEGRKSMELMINILYVFYSFSHFTNFHPMITKFKIGGIVMRTIGYEERRFDELMARRAKLTSANKGDLKKISVMLDKQDRLLYGKCSTTTT
jgi:hypothetical protein